MDLLLHNLRTIGTHHCDPSVGEEAANEIERLRAENQRLYSALSRAQAYVNAYRPPWPGEVWKGDKRLIQTALRGEYA